VIKLVAFDLDGTFLADDKSIPERNIQALKTAAEAGIWIVPATGRVYEAIPEEIRKLSFVRYCILANGAEVYDAWERKSIFRDELSLSESMEILSYLSGLDVRYDAFVGGAAYMTETFYNDLEGYAANEVILKMMLGNRHPVPHLEDYLVQRGDSVQKITGHFKNMELREEILREVPKRFPSTAVTTSLPSNMEINQGTANKGRALEILCESLGVEAEHTAAFGDGSNDIQMLQIAGFGYAMKNASQEIRNQIPRVTEKDNNAAGVGETLLGLLSEKEKM